MDLHRYALASGIVRRLRMVFLSISLVLISAMAIGVQQLILLERTTKQLTQSSMPVFERAAELERNLKNLLLLLQQLDTLTHKDAFGGVQRDIESQLAVMRSQIRSYAREGQSAQVTHGMQSALAQIELSANDILAAKRAILSHSASLDKMGARLGALRTHARHELERISFSAPREFAALVAPSAHAPQDAPPYPDLSENPTPSAQDRLSIVSTLTELTLELEAITDLAFALRKQASPVELDEIRTALSFKIRGITVLLGRLPDTPERAALARTVIQIRSLIFEEEGLVSTTRNVIEQSTKLEREKIKQIAPITLISSRLSQLIQSARADVGHAGKELNMALDSLVFIIVFSAVIALLVIFAALVFVVEQQINRRMAKLTSSVLAIAEGQNETDVAVRGPDELGKIARALEVFKLNALELQRSNTELEKFAYVAAHDLRSPLRAIQDLTDWTLEDPDTVLSRDGQQNMELLQQRIMRLNQLLSDLLEYSRVGKDASDVASVSLSSLVAETAELLDPDDLFSIRYTGPDTPVLTYVTPLRHILLNLINNAIKHHDRSQGQISVHAIVQNGELRCAIRDDGPGIEPQYHDRIFTLFQTLRPRDEVEGSGLGLAIIRKHLEHHGGQIEVRSDPATERGATFVFTLPERSHNAEPLDRAA